MAIEKIEMELLERLQAEAQTLASNEELNDEEGQPLCKECAAGKLSGEGQELCTDCAPGKWQASTGQAGCFRCPQGMYQPFAGFWSCYKCKTGTYASEYGATKCTTCSQCPRGRYGTTAGPSATSSAACACKDCGVGKYAPAGYNKCFSCPVGRFQPEGAKDRFTCYYCAPGQYQDAIILATTGNNSAYTYTDKRYGKLGREPGQSCFGFTGNVEIGRAHV